MVGVRSSLSAAAAVTFLFGTGWSGSAAAGAPVQQSASPVLEQTVELISVDVVVLDERGDPVGGLSHQDFTVTEDGMAQNVTSFEAIRFEESAATDAQPERFVASNTVARQRPERAFVVIYDDVHLTPLGARLAASEFEKLVDGLAPGDVLTVLSTARRNWWTARLPEGRQDLLAFARGVKGRKPMDRTPGRVSDWEAMQIHYGRDQAVLGMVARRYFANGLIAELAPPANERQSRRDLDVSYGLPMVRAKATEVYWDATRGMVASLEVMKRAVAALGTQRGRKAVLVLSEGFFYDSTRTELRQLVQAARRANAVLYFFDARGRSGPNAPGNEAESWRSLEERDLTATAANFARDAEGTESAALDTGGRVVKGTDDLAGAMLEVVRESRSYYLLGYVSSNTKRDGKFRKIKVSVPPPGLEVRARKGYYAPRKEDENEPPRAAGTLDPQVRAGLDSPFDLDGIPIRLASYVLGSGASGKATALLAAELDLRAVAFEARDGRQVGALESFAHVSPLEAGAGQVVEKRIDLSLPSDLYARILKAGLPILRSFELAPGAYQARLLIRDAGGRAIGTVRRTFKVPPAAGFHISTPILSDSLGPGAGGTEVPVPLAHRNFATGSRLFYAFDVFGAAPDGQGDRKVALRYVVRREGGSVFAESPVRTVAADADGTLSHRMILSLSGAAPGEYTLLLTVEDTANGTRLEQRDVFFVDPS